MAGVALHCFSTYALSFYFGGGEEGKGEHIYHVLMILHLPLLCLHLSFPIPPSQNVSPRILCACALPFHSSPHFSLHKLLVVMSTLLSPRTFPLIPHTLWAPHVSRNTPHQHLHTATSNMLRVIYILYLTYILFFSTHPPQSRTAYLHLLWLAYYFLLTLTPAPAKTITNNNTTTVFFQNIPSFSCFCSSRIDSTRKDTWFLRGVPWNVGMWLCGDF